MLDETASYFHSRAHNMKPSHHSDRPITMVQTSNNPAPGRNSDKNIGQKWILALANFHYFFDNKNSKIAYSSKPFTGSLTQLASSDFYSVLNVRSYNPSCEKEYLKITSSDIWPKATTRFEIPPKGLAFLTVQPLILENLIIRQGALFNYSRVPVRKRNVGNTDLNIYRFSTKTLY